MQKCKLCTLHIPPDWFKKFVLFGLVLFLLKSRGQWTFGWLSLSPWVPMCENRLGDAQHCRVRSAEELVGVDHNRHTSPGKFSFLLGSLPTRTWKACWLGKLLSSPSAVCGSGDISSSELPGHGEIACCCLCLFFAATLIQNLVWSLNVKANNWPTCLLHSFLNWGFWYQEETRLEMLLYVVRAAKLQATRTPINDKARMK